MNTLRLQVNIRPARPSDALAIRDLHVTSIIQLAHETYTEKILAAWSGNKEPNQYVEAMNSGQCMIVAEEGEELVGFASIVPEKSEVRAVYVHPNHARKGIGRKLLEQLEEIAHREGISELSLASSLNALPFYLSAGFSQGEHFEHQLQNGTEIVCVRMRKTLARK